MEDLAAGAEDERKWVSLDEAVSMLGLTRGFVLRATKERGYTRRQAHCRASPFFLRKEIESWVDFRQFRRTWLVKYKGSGVEKRWREKLDAETARRLFVPTEEAAALLGVSVETVRSLARRGRLLAYQSAPNHPGSRLWFSRRAVLQLKEDPERIRRQAEHWKGRAAMGHDADRGIQLARTVREGVPANWLTTREAAERLGVSVSRVREMRMTGRLRGEQIWRRFGPLRFWYYPDYEVDRVISLRAQVKELAGLPLLPVPLPPPIANALPIPASGGGESSPSASASASGGGKKETPFVPSASPFRLDADGPEPKWACDDVDLTRFFYLQGKSEY